MARYETGTVRWYAGTGRRSAREGAHVVVERGSQRLEGAVARVLGVVVQVDRAATAHELACGQREGASAGRQQLGVGWKFGRARGGGGVPAMAQPMRPQPTTLMVSDGTVSCTRAIGTGGLSPRKRRATTSAEPSKSSRAAQLTLAWCSF